MVVIIVELQIMPFTGIYHLLLFNSLWFNTFFSLFLEDDSDAFL